MNFIHAEMFYHEWNGLVTCAVALLGTLIIIGTAMYLTRIK